MQGYASESFIRVLVFGLLLIDTECIRVFKNQNKKFKQPFGCS